MTGIEINHLSKVYTIEDRKIYALDDINLTIDSQKRNVIIGPSGCGKSTLLRAIAGLCESDEGSIIKKDIQTSFVFQNPRLLPWKNVRENIAFSNNDPKLVDQWLKIMNLKDYEKAYPSQLSGGMKAKVSLARSFVYPNNFMLMDEPFSSLDEISKEKLQIELIEYMNINQSGFLFVSHDLEEALNLGERIIIMKKGKIVASFNLEDKRISKDELREIFKNLIIGDNNEK